jgi:surfactin synthase thioesterase subunit
MSYEFLKKLAAEGIPLPKQWVVSGFPAPSIPDKDRPWSRNAPMSDAEFMEECRGWNVNEVLFQGNNWKAFGGMMRDDFTLFDEYEYSPPPAHVARGEFPIPMQARFLTDDRRCRRQHLEMWKALTSEKLSFGVEECAGNHLFFYNNDHRAKWMNSVIATLPPGFA